MKINKLFVGLLCLMSIVLGSCKDDEYTMAELLKSEQVYFPDTNPTSYEVLMTDEAQTIMVPISRVKTDGDLTVKIAAVGADGDTISVPASVTFKDGEGSANVPVTYNISKIGYDNPADVQLSIAEEEYTTPYGYSYNNFTIVSPAPWETVGDATYIEQFVGCLYGVDNLSYAVELQENKLTPGYYRLVYPYDGKYGYNDEGDWDTSKDYYLEIHAENPDKVYITTQQTGMSWSYGMCYVSTLAGYYVSKGNEASAEPYYGTLKDGVLTFPAGSLLFGMADYNDCGLYSGGDGTPILIFPGATVADMSIGTLHEGIFTDTQGAAYAVESVTLGADVKIAKAVVVEASADPEAVADAIAEGSLEATDIVAGDNNIAIGDLTGDLMVVAVVLDGSTVKGIATSKFEYYGGGANPWKSLGMGMYTEDFVSSVFADEPQTYAVEILESSENPGLYRLVNPYGAAFPLNEEGDYDPNATNYLEINAMDPEGVYVAYQDIALDYGYGEMAIESWGYYYYENGYDLETLKSKGYLGTLKDGVITLPVFTRTKSDGTTANYQGLIYCGNDGYYGGGNGAFKVVLPEAVTAKMRKAASKKTHATRRLQSGSKATVMPVNKSMVKKAGKCLK